MSSVRRALKGYEVFSATSISASFNSSATETLYLDELTYTCEVTGTLNCTLTVQYQTGTATYAQVGTLTSVVTAPGVSTFQVNQIPGERTRVAVTGVSGSGTLRILVSGKGR
jgi:hypothetical protein